MNEPSRAKPVNSDARQSACPANMSDRRLRFATIAGGIIAIIGVWICATFANAQQPVLKILNLGSNQFNIVITNAVTTTNYTLFWTPLLADQNYPWEVLGVANVGTTNFVVDVGEWDSGFFRVLLGTDSDGDGVPDWQDAGPLDPAVGQLQVIIYSPANGSTISN